MSDTIPVFNIGDWVRVMQVKDMESLGYANLQGVVIDGGQDNDVGDTIYTVAIEGRSAMHFCASVLMRLSADVPQISWSVVDNPDAPLDLGSVPGVYNFPARATTHVKSGGERDAPHVVKVHIYGYFFFARRNNQHHMKVCDQCKNLAPREVNLLQPLAASPSSVGRMVACDICTLHYPLA